MAEAEVAESGARQTLVVVGADRGHAGELLGLLEKDFEIVALDVAPGSEAEALTASLAALALPRYALLAFAPASRAALCSAAAGDAALARLVLVAPDALRSAEDARELAPVFERLAAPVLVAFGTEDPRSALGRHYRGALRRCHFSLVYAAGAELAAERPAALAALISDFIRRGARFVVPDESLALQP